MSLKKAAILSILWTLVGIAFAGVVLLVDDGKAAGQYLTGFFIEKSLSLDNLFVFAILFGAFNVPTEDRRRLLMFGIAGAIVLRTIFILLGAAALDTFSWFTYVLGVLLLVTAFNIARHGDEEIDPEKNFLMKFLRRRNVSTTVATVAMIAFFDVMFAIDSIPAIFAITRDTFVVFAANAFSLMGLVSLFFVLEGLLERFRYLSQGLAVILAYVGLKILLEDVVHPPEWVSLAVVIGTLGVAAWLSTIIKPREDDDAEQRPEVRELQTG